MKTIVVNDKKINFAPKQKLIIIKKKTNAVDFKYMYNALKELSTDAFALYMYLYGIEKNYIWALSSQHVCENSKLSMRTYPKAVKELIEHKYLIRSRLTTDDGIVIDRNIYDFCETPKRSDNNT